MGQAKLRQTIVVLVLLMLIAMVLVFRGKPVEMHPGMTELNPAAQAEREPQSESAVLARPVSEGHLLEILRSGSDNSRLMALDLLLRSPGAPERDVRLTGLRFGRVARGHELGTDLYDRILAERRRFQGESGRLFYARMKEAAEGSQLLRSHFIEALSQSWSQDPPETVVEAIRHIGEFGLNEQEYMQSAAQLCRFRSTSFPRECWPAIRYHLEALREFRGFQVGPEAICRAAANPSGMVADRI